MTFQQLEMAETRTNYASYSDISCCNFIAREKVYIGVNIFSNNIKDALNKGVKI